MRGIGRWSAEMFLMFRLGRPDERALPSPETLEKHGEKGRPYRSVASWYLWRILELPPE